MFHILLPSFFSRSKECNLLLPLLKNGCSLIDPLVYWRLYQVLFKSISLFWKYSNKLKGCTKPGNLSFQNMKSFKPSIIIKKTALPTIKKT